MNTLASNLQGGLQNAWADVLLFAPKLLLFVVVLAVGYFIAKLLCKVLNRILERVGFDKLVERGGIKRALAGSKWDASDILSKIVFSFVMLCVLELAFGIFGPNPVSDLLTRMIAYLPNIFVAVVIVIVASAIAAGVKQIITAALGGLNYGRAVAAAAAMAIVIVGVFAALDQLNIAPVVVNGLFYAVLAVFVGSAIVAIGGGGIVPMRGVWEKAIGRIEREAPKVKEHAAGARQRIEGTTKEWEGKAEQIRRQQSHAE